MKLLLDTHIWIWILQSPERLGARTTIELHKETNDLWLSPVSTWEALLLHRMRRIDLGPDLVSWSKRSILGFQTAPLTHEIVFAAELLDLHQDPADRFLAATAQVLDLTLVTADQKLLGLGTIRTLGNR